MGLSDSVLRELAFGNEDIDSIARDLSRTKKDIVNATQVLKRRELISSVTRSDNVRSPINRGKYVITELGKYWVAQGLKVSPGQGSRSKIKTNGLVDRVWWQIRNYKMVTVRDILVSHTFTTERSSYIRVLKYLHVLESARIIGRSSRKIPCHQSNGMIQWYLVRDLGPKAPLWRQKTRCLYDPNSDSSFAI